MPGTCCGCDAKAKAVPTESLGRALPFVAARRIAADCRLVRVSGQVH